MAGITEKQTLWIRQFRICVTVNSVNLFHGFSLYSIDKVLSENENKILDLGQWDVV
jgi:hypothetical protein